MTPIEMLHARLDRMEDKQDRAEEKIDQLLAFKWKIVGVTSAVSLIFGIIIQVTLAIVGK